MLEILANGPTWEICPPKKKKPSINPEQPAGKGREKKKKTLVLTLGSAPEKGEKKNKKNPGINPGQRVRKGREKKNPWY